MSAHSRISREQVMLLMWCVALFATALFLYTRGNDFPIEFHPDEAPKATRILHGRSTYRQPLLLSTATALALRLTARSPSLERAVQTGRVVSAIFAAGAVVFFSIFAWRVRNRSLVAAIAVGLATLSCPQLLLLAHYMKEDTALVCTAAALLVAVTRYEQSSDLRNAALIGVAAGFLGSSKYAGLAMIPVAYWLVLKRSAQTPSRNGRPFALGLIISWCAVNYLIVMRPMRFLNGFASELVHPVTGHYGLANGVLFASPVWSIVASQLNPLIALLALIFLGHFAFCIRDRSSGMRLLVGGALLYLISLSLSRFVLDRHVLPVTVAIYVMAGFAVVELSAFVRQDNFRRVVSILLSVMLLVSTAGANGAIFHELTHDTRLQLRSWIREHLPSTAVIAEDRPAHLQEARASASSLRQTIFTPSDLFVTDLGSIPELRNKGVTHIVTCDDAYARLFTLYPTTAAAWQEVEQRRARYEELFSSATALFEAKPWRDVGGSTSPVVKVYAIAQ